MFGVAFVCRPAGVAGLKVVDSPPGERRRIAGAGVGRRRGDDDAKETSPPAAAAAAGSSSSAATTLSAAKANQARRRLSITAAQNQDASKVDGHAGDDVKDPLTKVLKSMAASSAAPAQAAAAPAASASSAPKKRRVFSHYSSLSKVGYVPFNPLVNNVMQGSRRGGDGE